MNASSGADFPGLGPGPGFRSPTKTMKPTRPESSIVAPTHPAFPVLIALFVTLPASLLAGCASSPDDRPELEIRIDPQPTLKDLPTQIHVVFENTADREFVVHSREDCLRVQVLVRTADGTAIPVEIEEEEACADEPTRFRIEPGETMEWGPYIFIPGEWQTPHQEPYFPPGEYAVEAGFVATSTRWDADTEATLEIMAGALPQIEILPEKEEWVQGETVNITLRFHNTAPVPFHFTSPNGCRDIEAYVMSNDVRLWPEDGPYPCTEAIEEFRVDPGEAIVDTVVWDGSANGTGGAPYAPPGDHDLKATLGEIESDWQVTSIKRVTLKPE